MKEGDAPFMAGRKKRDVEPLCIAPSESIRRALEAIGRSTIGIALITDAERRLLGTVTDGDIRRAILAGRDLDGPVEQLQPNDSTLSGPGPVTAPAGATQSDILRIMKTLRVRHLPILDEDAVVVDLVTLDELVPDPAAPVRALVMAGGFGRRLRPLTESEPKPMLRVGDRPILERTVVHLRESGVNEIFISTHYLPERILSHFGDGSEYGVKIRYLNEEEPLGTAGSLRLLPPSDERVLVVNGDIVTTVDYRAMVRFHCEHGSVLTVGVRHYSVEVPYGVVTAHGATVKTLEEKPVLDFLVNAGLYILEPEVIRAVPRDRPVDMTDLISGLLEQRKVVTSFPVVESWLDVGRPYDLERACAEVDR